MALAIALGLAHPSGALAGRLTWNENTGVLTYRNVPSADEAHRVRLDDAGADYRIRDATVIVIIGVTPCRHADDVFDLREVLCEKPFVTQFDAMLGDDDDHASATAALTVNFCGGGGRDVLTGGPERDFLGGGDDADVVRGGGENDILAVDLAVLGEEACEPGSPAGVERLEGGPGGDQIEGGQGPDELIGDAGDDRMFGYGGDDLLDGGAGGDVMLGLEGQDVLAGAAERDFLYGGEGDDRVEGGTGNDVLGRTARYDANGVTAFERAPALTVENGDDRLDGGEGDDALTAGPGESLDDFVDPLESAGRPFIDRSMASDAVNGADVLIGGDGRDSVSYLNRDRPIRVTLDGLADDGSAGEGDRVDPDLEVVAGGARADLMTAAPQGTFLFGDLDADVILGGPGPDELSGGGDEGRDRLLGAGGDDELRGGPGADVMEGDAGRDILLGGAGDDIGLGGRDVDALEGGTGADRLRGGPGNDCLEGFVFGPLAPGETFPCRRSRLDTASVGADGADVLHGGSGRDRLSGGPGEDVADYSDARRGVVVRLAGVPASRAAAFGPGSDPDDLASDIEGARGGGGADTLFGNGEDNLLDGGPGDDQVDGGGGVDRLRGGSGRDLLAARDGEPDALRCGTRLDLALVDADDEVVASLSERCELVDGGGSRVAGTARIGPRRACELPVRLPAVARVFRLEQAASVPWGTRVDASSCTARVFARAGSRAALLRGGRLSLHRRGRGLEVRLRGGARRRCGEGVLPVRRLEVIRALPGMTMRGRTAVARGAGGSWSMADGCADTQVRVRSGRVHVRELGGPR